MANCGITLNDLREPSQELECILKELMCTYKCTSLRIYRDNDGNLIFNIDGVENRINLNELIDVRLANMELIDSLLVLTMSNGDKLQVNLANAFQMNETLTTLTAVGNTLRYKDERGNTHEIAKVHQLSADANSNGEIVISVNGIQTQTSICDAVKSCETVTTLINNRDGSFTYTNEKGAQTTFSSGHITVTKNANNSLTFTYPNGTVVNYDETLTEFGTPTFNGDVLSLFYQDENGDINTRTVDFSKYLVVGTSNPDGSITVSQDNTTRFTIPADILTELTDTLNTFSYRDEHNNIRQFTKVGSHTLATNSGTLTSEVNGVDSTPVDLCPAVEACETITTVVPDGNTGFIYTNEAGNATTIPFPTFTETTTTVTDTITGHQIGTYTNEVGSAVVLNETVTSMPRFEVNGTNLEIDYVDENGVTNTLAVPLTDICNACANCVQIPQAQSFTTANRPATGQPGQIIYLSDTGEQQYWNGVTNAWVTM